MSTGVSKKRAYPPGSPNKNVRSKTRRRVQSSDGQELIQSVFAETWAAFYAWECEYARESIKSLSSVLRTTEVLPTASARASSAEDFISAFKGLKLDSGPRPTNNVFTGFATAVCEEFLDDIECINIDIPPPGEGLSSPPYESCTPIKTSIMKGDDSHYMPFIPFADDPGFKFEYHIDRYKYTAWQQHDPDKVHKHCKADIVGVGDGDEFFDLQIITFEAACQLHNIYKLNFEQIDKANVLPLRMLTSDESPGLLDLIPKLSHPRQITKHLMPQNNLQLSPSKLVSRSPRIITSESSKVKVEVSNFISRFCHRLSCSTSYCSRHLDSSSPPLKIPPKLKKFDLSQSAAEACGDNCFLHLHLSGSVSPVYAASKEWTKDDTDILEVVLHSAPDASPCDISIICRKSCQEVFEKRTQMIPDAQVELLLKRDKKRRPVKKRRPAKRRVESFKDSNPYNFTPPEMSCAHEGPCTKANQCSCAVKYAHCTWACRCDSSCSRAWRGCACARSKEPQLCRTKKCPCFKADRECDPIVCLSCDARNSDFPDGCQNAGIQRGDSKATIVLKSGQWGFGLFLLESANNDDFIIEYVGELIYEPTWKSRSDLSKHRKRAYPFKLNSTYDIDATYVGNESRYINHSWGNENCVARVKLVHGDHRIGIYATRRIEAGEELIMNYGADFF